LAKHGTLLIRSPNNYPIPSPYLGIANRAMRQMHGLLTEFGMTPSARSRVPAGAPPSAADPFDALLDG
jgi:phage terminase small subunit